LEALKEYLAHILCKLPIAKSCHQQYTEFIVDEKAISQQQGKVYWGASFAHYL